MAFTKKLKRYKIIHIQVLPIMSGVQKAMYDILIRLDRHKYDITVLCQSEGELTEALKQQNIRCLFLNALKREINPYFDLIALYKLYRIFRKEKYDLVHTHSSKSGFLGRLAAKIAGVPGIIHTVQGFSFHQFSAPKSIYFFTSLERITGLISNKIIIVNNDDFEYAIKNKIASQTKLVKIYNGIDIDEHHLNINKGRKRSEFNIPTDCNVVGFIGRLWEQKAPQDFISAVPIVLENISNVVFLIIGDGHLRSSLETLAQKLHIQDHIQFLGWRNDVPEILKILDVFVQTSLWEGLSLSILEAMAAGKPIIATNIKGNNELVVDGITGFLVLPRNPEMVGYYITRLLQDKRLVKKMGRLGRKRVEEKFDIKLHVELIKNIYHQILTV